MKAYRKVISEKNCLVVRLALVSAKPTTATRLAAHLSRLIGWSILPLIMYMNWFAYGGVAAFWLKVTIRHDILLTTLHL